MTDPRPYVTLPEWAESRHISVQRAHTLYKAGRLPGAYESGPSGKRGAILLPRLTIPTEVRHPDAQEVVVIDDIISVRGG